MRADNWTYVPSDIDYRADADWSRIEQTEYSFEDGTSGKRVAIDGEPVFARLHRSEGHGQTKRSASKKRWVNEEGDIERESSGSAGDPAYQGSSYGPMLEMDADIESVWGKSYDPETERIISQDDDAIYHAVREDGTARVTRYDRVDVEAAFEWSDDLPEEDRVLEFNGEEIPIDDTDLVDIPYRLRDQLMDAGAIERQAIGTPAGYVTPDTTWIREGDRYFRCDHDSQPTVLDDDAAAYQVALQYLDHEEPDPREKVPVAVPVLPGLTNIQTWVELVQRQELPEDLAPDEVLEGIREERDSRLGKHVFGQVEAEPYIGTVKTDSGQYRVEDIDAVRVMGSKRFESIEVTAAPRIEEEAIDDEVAGTYLVPLDAPGPTG